MKTLGTQLAPGCGMFPFCPFFLLGQRAPSWSTVSLSLAGEQRLGEANNPETRETARPSKADKTDTRQKCKGIQNESSDSHSPARSLLDTGLCERKEKKKSDLY